MKNLGLLFLLLILASCDKTFFCEYAVENETNYEISIEGFDRFDMQKNPIDNYLNNSETIYIMPNSSFSVVKARGYHAEPDGIFSSIEIDSINIIFNNEKILVQECKQYLMQYCNIDHNIMGFDTEYDRIRIGRSMGEKEYRYTYTITEEDYNNAILIGK